MKLRLVPFTLEAEPVALAALAVMTADGHAQFLLGYRPDMAWSDFVRRQLDNQRGVDLPAGIVASAQLMAVVDAELVGRVSIRFKLNEYLFERGGHIGYYVLPDFRNQGYATEMLRQSLIVLRSHTNDRCLVTCEDDNAPSARVAEKCGGVLERVVPAGDGAPALRRYWIE